MIIKKRGIGDVVVSVLIILLVIIVSTILWIAVRANIDKATKSSQTECLSISLDNVGCEAYGHCNYYAGGAEYATWVTIKRNSGKGDLKGIRFIFEDFFKRTSVFDRPTTGFDELESIRFDASNNLLLGFEPKSVSSVALAGADNFVCRSFSSPVECTTIIPAPAPGHVPGTSSTEPQCCQYYWNLTECAPQGVDCSIFNNNQVNCINAKCNWESSNSICTGTFIRSKYCCSENPYEPINPQNNPRRTQCSTQTFNCCIDRTDPSISGITHCW